MLLIRVRVSRLGYSGRVCLCYLLNSYNQKWNRCFQQT
uniref:Uncharacterized protein n=1 Tax=Arundo donax TaxID=35708 RepID=A0A0A9BPQ6_ARUDO